MIFNKNLILKFILIFLFSNQNHAKNFSECSNDIYKTFSDSRLR